MADSFRPISTMSQSQSQSGATGGVWNEMTDASGQVRPHWQQLAAKINRWTLGDRLAMVSASGRMIEDLGTTFNVFSDVGCAGQPYELDSIPLVIPPADWAHVSSGLAQRIRLLEAVLADLYGSQELLRKGLIPPDLVHSSPSFLQFVSGIQPPGGRFILSTGCDLVRNANGAWAVLRDHVGTPGGLGQVLENRNVVSKLIADPFEAMKVARLGEFLNLERSTLQEFALSRGEEANIVFLTPGFRHPAFFEHAYKARLLGFPLVEPADLTVRERRLFLKTLSGLRKIDGVVCRIDGDSIDPLETWDGGGIGVPGMVEAWRSGNVAIANAPGSGFASNPALMSFLPRICREWFGEEIKLPFVETWWLGQPGVRRRVLDQLDRYVLMSASTRVETHLPLQCSSLSPAARRQWIATIEARPHDFVVQAEVTPSQSPSLESRSIRQRPVVWRAYTLNADEQPEVLPGGLARVGKASHSPQLWPGHAGFTKDVWVPDAKESLPRTKIRFPRTAGGRHAVAPEVPSRIAEQLFWAGRYADRIELATRLLRATLRCLGGEAGRTQEAQLSACLTLLAGSGLTPDDMVIHPARTIKTLSRLIHDPAAGGGIPGLTRSLLINAAAARDRLSDDTWRFFNRLENIVNPPEVAPGTAELLRTLDTLVLHLAAFAGMQAENMTRGQGWRFLELGRRIERAHSGISLLRTAAKQGDDETPLLDPLLESCDSVMTYRRRYFSRPQMAPVIDLIFFDRSNPRSVAYQFQVIYCEITRVTDRPDFGLMPAIREQAKELDARFDDPRVPDIEEFDAMIESIETLSDSLTQHFFSHSVRRVY